MGLRCLARADCVAVIAIVRGRDGSWARLLAVLTLQCAAKPYWWHGGQLAQVATSRVNVRMKGPRPPPAGPRPPPIGLACELKGVSAQDAFTETVDGPDGSQASRRSLYDQGDDGGGTPKDPASRCVRWPRRRR